MASHDHQVQDADDIGLKLDPEDQELLRKAQKNPDALVTDTPNDQKLKRFSVICIIVNRMIGEYLLSRMCARWMVLTIMFSRERYIRDAQHHNTRYKQRGCRIDFLDCWMPDNLHGDIRLPRTGTEHSQVQFTSKQYHGVGPSLRWRTELCT